MRNSQTSTFFPVIETKPRGSLNFDENGQIAKLKQAKSIQIGIEQQALTGPFKIRQNTISLTNIGGGADALKRKNPIAGNSQKEIFKQLSEKLDDHQSQIDARNATIEELEHYVITMKAELLNERSALNAKTEQNTKLQENNDKLTGRLRQSNTKFDDLYAKFTALDQEYKVYKENEKTRNDQWVQKENGLNKRISELEDKLNSQVAEQKQKKKNEKNKELAALQAQIQKLEAELDKGKKSLIMCEDKVKSLEKEKLEYCTEALDLRQRCAHYKERIEGLTREQSSHEMALKDELTQLRMNLATKTQQLEKTEGGQKEQLQAQKEFERKISSLQDTVTKLTADCDRLKRSEKDKVEEISILKEYVSKKDGQMAAMTSDKVSNAAAAKNETENLKAQVSSLSTSLAAIKSKEGSFKANIDKLEKGEQELLKSLKCNHCQKFIKEPITIIPCGHSFCFGCKKAYAKDCIKCGSKVKVEAMYRNELLDDIINMYKTLGSVKEAMLSVVQSLH